MAIATNSRLMVTAILGFAAVAACSSDPSTSNQGTVATSPGGSSASGSKATGASGASISSGAAGSAMSSGVAGSPGSSGASGGSPANLGTDPDGGTVVDPETGLPKLPLITNARARVTGGSAEIDFDPVDAAKDYRIYVLPAGKDISVDPDGHVNVKGATYRCAGNRMAAQIGIDDAHQDAWFSAQVDQAEVAGYKRSTSEATLGYVYAATADGRVPVYALGDPSPSADSQCGLSIWHESRSKRYVTSDSERADLISKGWRDDGIVFYAPTSQDGTTSIFLDDSDQALRAYFPDGAEAGAHSTKTRAFLALKAAGTETLPLMRVLYRNWCGASHDELVAGKAKFERAYHQGDGLPLWNLHWSGLREKTTLVVEALDQLCPWQDGFVGPTEVPADKQHSVPWRTLDGIRAASPTGEVFINAQGDASNLPQAIARTFIDVSPALPPPLDWSFGFGANDSEFGPFADALCDVIVNAGADCFAGSWQTSDTATTLFNEVQSPWHTVAPMLGALWVGVADDGAGSKFRYVPKKQAKMAGDSFLYLTMQVDSYTSGRRYPQLLISDTDVKPWPIANNFMLGKTLIVQTESTGANWPFQYQVELCDHLGWDVSGQCPAFPDFRYRLDAQNPDQHHPLALPPISELSEHAAGLDQTMRFEVYASTGRVYLMLDGQPYGCADLPTAQMPSGSVNVGFGDVLYHSGADSITSSFLTQRDMTISIRHFENLGFKSGVPAPQWNEERMPCVPASELGMNGGKGI